MLSCYQPFARKHKLKKIFLERQLTDDKKSKNSLGSSSDSSSNIETAEDFGMSITQPPSSSMSSQSMTSSNSSPTTPRFTNGQPCLSDEYCSSVRLSYSRARSLPRNAPLGDQKQNDSTYSSGDSSPRLLHMNRIHQPNILSTIDYSIKKDSNDKKELLHSQNENFRYNKSCEERVRNIRATNLDVKTIHRRIMNQDHLYNKISSNLRDRKSLQAGNKFKKLYQSSPTIPNLPSYCHSDCCCIETLPKLSPRVRIPHVSHHIPAVSVNNDGGDNSKYNNRLHKYSPNNNINSQSRLVSLTNNGNNSPQIMASYANGQERLKNDRPPTKMRSKNVLDKYSGDNLSSLLPALMTSVGYDCNKQTRNDESSAFICNSASNELSVSNRQRFTHRKALLNTPHGLAAEKERHCSSEIVCTSNFRSPRDDPSAIPTHTKHVPTSLSSSNKESSIKNRSTNAGCLFKSPSDLDEQNVESCSCNVSASVTALSSSARAEKSNALSFVKKNLSVKPSLISTTISTSGEEIINLSSKQDSVHDSLNSSYDVALKAYHTASNKINMCPCSIQREHYLSTSTTPLIFQHRPLSLHAHTFSPLCDSVSSHSNHLKSQHLSANHVKSPVRSSQLITTAAAVLDRYVDADNSKFSSPGSSPRTYRDKKPNHLSNMTNNIQDNTVNNIMNDDNNSSMLHMNDNKKSLNNKSSTESRPEQQTSTPVVESVMFLCADDDCLKIRPRNEIGHENFLSRCVLDGKFRFLCRYKKIDSCYSSYTIILNNSRIFFSTIH